MTPPQTKTPWIDNETKSLFELGFVMPMDFLFLALEVVGGTAALIWILVTKPDFIYVVATLVVLNGLLSVWLITLIYRCSYFVLKMRAVMETMPEAAGKIAFSIFQQSVGSPSQEKMQTL
jgi:hypothetical protein